MIDPATAIMAAGAAFNAITQGLPDRAGSGGHGRRSGALV